MTTNTDKKEHNQLITIKGLKGVGNVELNLMPNQRVYTFIGSNGVGKTKVLEALFQGEFFSHQYLSDCLIINSYEPEHIEKIVFSSFKCQGKEWSYLGHTLRNTFEKHQKPIVMIGTNSRTITGEIKNYKLPSFEKRKGIYIKQVIDAIINEKMPNLGAIEDLASWFVSRAESDSKWQAEEDNRGFEISVLLKILNEIDASIDPSYMMKYGEDDIRIKIKKNKDELETKLSELSSGFVSLVRIVQAIINGYSNFTNEINLTHVKGVVFIDEIESHLHLEWQVKIIPLLKKIFPHTTFYIATHSPLILTQLQQGEAYRLVCGTDKVVRTELIEQPSKKLFDDVLDDAFDINLNQLKRDQMLKGSQTEAKKKLLDLINNVEGVV
jgi:predicted ATP-binding protein involved in virulence